MYLIGCVEGSIWGFIYDELEFRKILMLVNCLTMLNSFLMKFTSYNINTCVFSTILNEHLKIGAFIIIYPHVSRILDLNMLEKCLELLFYQLEFIDLLFYFYLMFLEF